MRLGTCSGTPSSSSSEIDQIHSCRRYRWRNTWRLRKESWRWSIYPETSLAFCAPTNIPLGNIHYPGNAFKIWIRRLSWTITYYLIIRDNYLLKEKSWRAYSAIATPPCVWKLLIKYPLQYHLDFLHILSLLFI